MGFLKEVIAVLRHLRIVRSYSNERQYIREQEREQHMKKP